MKKIFIYDTTLRDGAQAAGISFTADDKLKIAKALDGFGIDYIEGGWPGSNQTDNDFFKKIQSVKFKKSVITAFGSTRRKDIAADRDNNLNAIIKSKVRAACIFGKTWDLHIIHALRTSLKENLNMITESIRYLNSKKIKVIYDAEHFFDGFKANREYAVETIKTVIQNNAVNVTLCDTNGATLPDEVNEIISSLIKELDTAFPGRKYNLGIHAHNDSDCAVANSVIAIQRGITLVQGTINGIGERCGNANLCSIIPAIELKLKHRAIPENNLIKITELSRYVSEVLNIIPDNTLPYVGANAFAHKAGIHVSAVTKHSGTYEHVNPEKVGNTRKILISELSGRSNIISKVEELKLDFAKDTKSTDKIIHIIKKMEAEGYQFDEADGSFALTVHRALKARKPFFELKGFRVIIEKRGGDKRNEMYSEATLKIAVDGKIEHSAAEGDGPVNALDNALRKALERFYPQLKEMSLTDFKVRVINATGGTAAKVRVVIESRDKKNSWNTIGVSENIIEASWHALVDAIEYKLLKS